MADVMKTREYECQIGENETLGLVFPVYYWGLPTVVVSFLNRLKLSGEKPYVWAVITCGSGIGAADRPAEIGGKAGGNPGGRRIFPGDAGQFCAMFKAPGKEEAEKILEQADSRMEEILGEIQKRGPGEESGVKALMLSASMQTLYRNGRKTAPLHRGRHLRGLRSVRRFLPGERHPHGERPPVLEEGAVRLLHGLPEPVPEGGHPVRKTDQEKREIRLSQTVKLTIKRGLPHSIIRVAAPLRLSMFR